MRSSNFVVDSGGISDIPNMSGESRKQIEKLGVNHADEEVEGAVRVRHDEEQCCFLISQRVQLQFIVHGEVTQFLDVEGGEPGTTGNEDGFCGLSCTR